MAYLSRITIDNTAFEVCTGFVKAGIYTGSLSTHFVLIAINAATGGQLGITDILSTTAVFFTQVNLDTTVTGSAGLLLGRITQRTTISFIANLVARTQFSVVDYAVTIVVKAVADFFCRYNPAYTYNFAVYTFILALLTFTNSFATGCSHGWIIGYLFSLVHQTVAIVVQAIAKSGLGLAAAMAALVFLSGLQMPGLGLILTWSLVGLLSFVLNIYFWAIIISIVASFLAPFSDHPALVLVRQLSEPVMAPFRKILPPMGGLDLSPIFVFLALQIIRVVIIMPVGVNPQYVLGM